jgi:hypothetical protein
MKQIIVSKGNGNKPHPPMYPAGKKDPVVKRNKAFSPAPIVRGNMGDDLDKLRLAAASIHRIRVGAQRELEMARKMRSEAQRYQQETATRARSEAHQLILRTRLETQKEIEELISNASAEIQKVLADIRVIRITAQEELAAQRKFTTAARLSSLALALQDEIREPERKKIKQLAVKK